MAEPADRSAKDFAISLALGALAAVLAGFLGFLFARGYLCRAYPRATELRPAAWVLAAFYALFFGGAAFALTMVIRSRLFDWELKRRSDTALQRELAAIQLQQDGGRSGPGKIRDD